MQFLPSSTLLVDFRALTINTLSRKISLFRRQPIWSRFNFFHTVASVSTGFGLVFCYISQISGIRYSLTFPFLINFNLRRDNKNFYVVEYFSRPLILSFFLILQIDFPEGQFLGIDFELSHYWSEIFEHDLI